MQNCKWKTELVTLGIAVVALANSLAPSKAQAEDPFPEENFAWITNINGVTWKAIIDKENNHARLSFDDGEKSQIAEILVPEHAIIDYIVVRGCVNLTNIILHPTRPRKSTRGETLSIWAVDSGLRNITCKQTMRDLISLSGEDWWAIQWTELKLPKMEIKARTTANGPEVEVIWREGNLQIADAVNGEWRDHIGNSPLRFPLAVTKPQQFFRISRSR